MTQISDGWKFGKFLKKEGLGTVPLISEQCVLPDQPHCVGSAVKRPRVSLDRPPLSAPAYRTPVHRPRNMSDRKRKNPPASGSRKKRMPTKVVHELPESLFKAPNSPSSKAVGLQKKAKKNQGGTRQGATKRSQKPSRSVQASPLSTSEGASTIVEAGTSPTDSAMVGLDLSGDVDHVIDWDHGTDAPTESQSAIRGAGLSDSDDDSDVEIDDDEVEYETYAEAVRTNVAVFLPACGNIFIVQGWDASRNRTTVRRCVCSWDYADHQSSEILFPPEVSGPRDWRSFCRVYLPCSRLR